MRGPEVGQRHSKANSAARALGVSILASLGSLRLSSRGRDSETEGILMQNVTAIPDLPVETGSRSSALEKTTPELRRKPDRAIVDYNPPGYLARFKKFGLARTPA